MGARGGRGPEGGGFVWPAGSSQESAEPTGPGCKTILRIRRCRRDPRPHAVLPFTLSVAPPHMHQVRRRPFTTSAARRCEFMDDLLSRRVSLDTLVQSLSGCTTSKLATAASVV